EDCDVVAEVCVIREIGFEPERTLRRRAEVDHAVYGTAGALVQQLLEIVRKRFIPRQAIPVRGAAPKNDDADFAGMLAAGNRPAIAPDVYDVLHVRVQIDV